MLCMPSYRSISGIKIVDRVFALVDCNNFYVSCERLFRPDLHNKPVLVLSNNDGCVVSRSAEAKALGIGMAVPVFRIREQIKTHNITLFSCNFALYGDISARIMQLLERLVPDVEIYSIDEAFLDLTGIPCVNDFAQKIRQQIKTHIGIPVCIGIAPTKTLAKLANNAAKKTAAFNGVIDLTSVSDQQKLLAKTKPNVIWGIGKRLNKRLEQMGIFSGLQLAQTNASWLRQHFSIHMEKTVLELNGQSCLPMQDNDKSTQQILHSRSFAERIVQLNEMQQVLCGFTARAAEKLRLQKKQAKAMSVFIRTSYYTDKTRYHAQQANGHLAVASSDTRTLSALAMQLLDRIWLAGPAYAKAGIILCDFSSIKIQQLQLFTPEYDAIKSDQLMQVLDKINHQHRHTKSSKAIWLGNQGISSQYPSRKQHMSPAYTTKWSEILQVK